MISITTLLENTLMLNCYLLTQTVSRMMFMKNFLSTNTCLILVTIQRIQSFFMRVIKKKDESEVKIFYEFVILKSKMYSIKIIDGKESNMAKGVNIATI